MTYSRPIVTLQSPWHHPPCHSRLRVVVTVHALGDGREGLPVDARVLALVEGVDLDVEAGVLAEDLLRVLVSVERVHQHQRNFAVERVVQMLRIGMAQRQPER